MDTIQSILNAMVREAVSPQTAAVAIAVIGLNIHFGFTGLLNIGQSAFMLLGAYGFAISITHGLPLVVAVLIGLAAAFVFALVLGMPTLKLRGDYLAIVTISAAEIIRYVGRSVGYDWLLKLTHGAQGIPGSQYRGPFTDLSPFGDGNTTILSFSYHDVAGGAAWVTILGLLLVAGLIAAMVLASRRLSGRIRPAAIIALSILTLLLVLFLAPVTGQNTGVRGWWFTVVTWVLVGISTVVVLLLVKSPWGRLLKGIREDEDAIRSLGKNVFAIKMQALIIGGLFGALGGIMFVLPATVQPDSMGRSLTFFCYTALLLGGAASIFGPVLGSLLFFVGRAFIISASNAYVPDSVLSTDKTAQFAFVVIGVALMLLVIFRPQGILGDKRELRFNV
ncbi:branched-chain amino acid ABC transporter permease [Nocardioides sp.]|uniref:branched-chain amino acid ABC transporter permease n=1 Tax=Nocardioides sp. TaxID=35761 RepID=UPI0031FEA3F7|nr:leucine/isoleucine/valine transporter permease subunit [Nocardioides sp.]